MQGRPNRGRTQAMRDQHACVELLMDAYSTVCQARDYERACRQLSRRGRMTEAHWDELERLIAVSGSHVRSATGIADRYAVSLWGLTGQEAA